MDQLDLKGTIAIQVILIIIPTAALATRLWIRISNLHSALNLSDYALIVGYIAFIGWIVVTSLSLTYGLLSPEFINAEADLSPEAGKALYAADFIFDIGVWSPKISLLCLYYQVFGKEQANYKERIALHIISFYVIATLFCVMGLDAFICPNVSDNWSDNPTACAAWYNITQLITDFALNLSTDILLICYPLFMLRRITMDSKSKLGLAVTFSLGIITIICCTGRFICGALYFVYPPLLILIYTGEICTSLVVVCLPILRVLIVRGPTQFENANAARIEEALHAYQSTHCVSLESQSGQSVELKEKGRTTTGRGEIVPKPLNTF